MITRELLCYTCRAARMSHGQLMGCRGIGNPVLVMLYGNRCRRYEAKRRTFEDTTAREYCEGCLFFVAGTDSNEPDFCAENATAEDITTDSRDIVTRCRLFKPNI